MSKTKVRVTFELTRHQAEALGQMLVGALLASDECGTHELRAYQVLHDALREAEKAADAEDIDRAARTKPCSRCGRAIVHSARGLQLPAEHECPHGTQCVSQFGCRACKDARVSRTSSTLGARQ